ncbi:MAG: HAD-IA family hydrolase [Bdellovibrionaceae bacterium]|nr:HAD-IA family hydrolase [Pseudobdellovibrionaceae bacterium]
MAMSVPFLFFDVGGTLLRTARPVGELYGEIARHYGVKADAGLLDAAFRKVLREQRTREPGLRSADDRAWWRHVVALTWEGVGRPEGFPTADYFEELYAAYARPDQWRLFPDVLPALERAADKGWPLGVFSNWDVRLRGLLHGLGLAEYFEAIAISSEIGAEKPQRLAFERAGQLAGRSERELILIGDDPEIDLRGAREAGWLDCRLRGEGGDLGRILEEIESQYCR